MATQSDKPATSTGNNPGVKELFKRPAFAVEDQTEKRFLENAPSDYEGEAVTTENSNKWTEEFVSSTNSKTTTQDSKSNPPKRFTFPDKSKTQLPVSSPSVFDSKQSLFSDQ